MSNVKKVLLSFLASVLIFVPTMVLAQTTECDILKQQLIENGGGRVAELPAYCNESDVYNKVVGVLYYLVGIAAVISIIYGGYMYMTAGSNESRKGKGKTIIIYTIAGIVVAVMAAVIVNAVIRLVVDNKFF